MQMLRICASKVFCCSFFPPTWTNYKLSKHVSVLMQEPCMLVETFRGKKVPNDQKNPIALRAYCLMYEATKTIPQALNQENATDPLHRPIKEIFHLEQSWVEVPIVSLLC